MTYRGLEKNRRRLCRVLSKKLQHFCREEDIFPLEKITGNDIRRIRNFAFDVFPQLFFPHSDPELLTLFHGRYFWRFSIDDDLAAMESWELFVSEIVDKTIDRMEECKNFLESLKISVDLDIAVIPFLIFPGQSAESIETTYPILPFLYSEISKVSVSAQREELFRSAVFNIFGMFVGNTYSLSAHMIRRDFPEFKENPAGSVELIVEEITRAVENTKLSELVLQGRGLSQLANNIEKLFEGLLPPENRIFSEIVLERPNGAILYLKNNFLALQSEFYSTVCNYHPLLDLCLSVRASRNGIYGLSAPTLASIFGI